MCDPVSAAIAVAVTTTAATGAGILQQNAYAKAQRKAIDQQLAVNREEVRQQASAEMFDDMRAARREQAKVRTAAGEAGLGLNSGSIEAMLMDSAMQMELQGDRTLANMESRHASNVAEATSMHSQVKSDTLLTAGLKLGASAAQGFSGVQSAKLTR